MKRSEFKKIWKSVDRDRHAYAIQDLSQMCKSSSAHTRFRGLLLMRKQIAKGRLSGSFFRIGKSLIEDCDNDCRWQALIVVGEFIGTKHEDVWKVICRYGTSNDDDMRTGVATVLLEHLLEHHYNRYFLLLKEKILRSSPMLGDTLSMCAYFGQARHHKREIQSLVRSAANGG